MAAQSLNAPANKSPGFFALPIAGAPLSFDQVEERSQRDGSNPEVITSKLMRDTAGRIRIDGSPHPVIMDPVAGFTTVLVPENKTAIRVPLPKPESEPDFMFFGLVDGPPGSPNSTATTEQLGKRWLEGVEFEGTRSVRTYETTPQTTETHEDWFSEDLKLMGLMLASGYSKIDKAHIQNLRRDEPDPALFSIPADYRTMDVQLPPHADHE